jgi:hypothetical protein
MFSLAAAAKRAHAPNPWKDYFDPAPALTKTMLAAAAG